MVMLFRGFDAVSSSRYYCAVLMPYLGVCYSAIHSTTPTIHSEILSTLCKDAWILFAKEREESHKKNMNQVVCSDMHSARSFVKMRADFRAGPF